MAETKIIVDIGQAITQLQNNPRLGDELGKLLLKDVWTEAQGALNDAAAMLSLVRHMVHANILLKPTDWHWTYQGLGMVRVALDPYGIFRLNVWHHALRIPNISCIHTHPWDLKSYCLGGEITNVRYHSNMPGGMGPSTAYDPNSSAATDTVTYYPAAYMKLGCGSNPNGAQLSGEQRCTLYPQEPEVYRVGESYLQGRDEIHESRYTDGTVTLNVRTNKREDQSATVYWPAYTPWVDAKQSIATRDEIMTAVSAALSNWETWPPQAAA